MKLSVTSFLKFSRQLSPFCVPPRLAQSAGKGYSNDMGEKDIAEKMLEEYNDVFADIVNVLLFDGEALVKEDALTEASRLTQYKADDRLHEQERDVAKFWQNDGAIRICLYGLENQTDVDTDIPLRVISYDGAGYRMQLLADRAGEDGKKKKSPRFPVVTLVLYFGTRRWNRPRSLAECLKIPPRLRPYVSDYKVNVFEIAWLEPETVAKFKSDFRIVADYFVQLRTNREYRPPRETVRHVHEVLQMMAVLSGDRRFEEAQNRDEQESGKQGGKNMYDVLSRMLDRGVAQGRTEGQNRILELNRRLLAAGRADDLLRASSDEAYLQQLLEEEGLKDISEKWHSPVLA